MKNIKIKTYIISITLAALSNIVLAQAPLRQYCGGNNGSVITPARALGSDLSDYSTLKLRTPNCKKDHVYQNFVFSPAATKGTRVVFVIQTDAKFNPTENTNLNLTFYASMSDEVNADTLRSNEVQITKVNEALNLYEFSFVVSKNFDTAGILLQGGGIFKIAKIYKVYLAIQDTGVARFALTK